LPRFTVLIPTHNHGPLLGVSAMSALAQSERDMALYIVGDGMDDATRGAAGELADADRRVRVFDLPKDPKRCAANRHRALAEADSEFVAYLDDDDFWFPDHLQQLGAALDQADFAHTRPFLLTTRFTVQIYQLGLDSLAIRHRMIEQSFNFVSPTQSGHRLAAYRALAEGWATPPDGVANDLHMWRKFMAVPGLRFGASPMITTVHLPTSIRPELDLQHRLRELRFWSRVLSQHGVRQRLARLFTDSEAARPSWVVDENKIWFAAAERLIIGAGS
jgi:GalNAc5-diNAcBac-PP-undecaprenol beta-1,3-glucosyltransferase